MEPRLTTHARVSRRTTAGTPAPAPPPDAVGFGRAISTARRRVHLSVRPQPCRPNGPNRRPTHGGRARPQAKPIPRAHPRKAPRHRPALVSRRGGCGRSVRRRRYVAAPRVDGMRLGRRTGPLGRRLNETVTRRRRVWIRRAGPATGDAGFAFSGRLCCTGFRGVARGHGHRECRGACARHGPSRQGRDRGPHAVRRVALGRTVVDAGSDAALPARCASRWGTGRTTNNRCPRRARSMPPPTAP